MKTPFGAFETAHSDPRRLPSITFPIISVDERRSRPLVGVAKIMSHAKEQGMTMKVMTALMAAGFVAASGAAWAATATDTGDMLVKAEVVSTCEVTATAADFGQLTVAASKFSADTATSTLSVTCTVPTTFSVVADAGDNASGDESDQRNLKLVGGTDTIPYSLLQGTTATTLSTKWIDETTAAASKDVTVTAKIDADTPATALGDYSDTVTFTVTYVANNN